MRPPWANPDLILEVIDQQGKLSHVLDHDQDLVTKDSHESIGEVSRGPVQDLVGVDMGPHHLESIVRIKLGVGRNLLYKKIGLAQVPGVYGLFEGVLKDRGSDQGLQEQVPAVVPHLRRRHEVPVRGRRHRTQAHVLHGLGPQGMGLVERQHLGIGEEF